MEKRLSALVPALALCLSLALPVSAAEAPTLADPTAFTDAAQIHDWQAVASLAGLGVIHGKGDGSFDPDTPMTRAEAATLLTQMLCGGNFTHGEWDEEEPAFVDIADHWAREYIQFADSLRLIAGRGDGIFDPDGTVTLRELTKMALITLGYNPAELEGEDWAKRADHLMQVNGVTIEREAISKIETGDRFVTDYELMIFAKVLRVSMEWLTDTE